MSIKNQQSQGLTYFARSSAKLILLTTVCLAGCTGEEEQAISDAKVQTVTAYDMTLDAEASPEQVAYTLTRALADDVRHAQAHEYEQHTEAVNLQFKLAAYSTLEERVISALNSGNGRRVTSLGEQRAKKIYDVVEQWGSIVAHYVPSFADSFEEADKRMALVTSSNTTFVEYKVSHKPDASTDEERQPATLLFEMIQEQADGIKYWRVAKVDFKRPAVPVKTAVPTTQDSE